MEERIKWVWEEDLDEVFVSWRDATVSDDTTNAAQGESANTNGHW